MAFLAPYTNSMRLGQGYNSYSQQICMDKAVTFPGFEASLINVAGPSTFTKPKLTTITSTNNAIAPPAAPASSPAGKDSVLPTSKIITPTAGPRKAEESSLLNGDFQNTLSTLVHSVTPSIGGADAAALASEPNAVTAKSLTAGKVARHIDNSSADKLFKDAEMAANESPQVEGIPYDLNEVEEVCRNQTVTYSTKSIENVSEIVDALNISSSLAITYGTITGNASAGFVNEEKINSSDINYMVTVKVTNESPDEPQNMEFDALPGLEDFLKKDPKKASSKFTELYGDSFISGFIEGGEFSAIVSINVHNKDKVKDVSQAASATLAVGPTPLSVKGGGSLDKYSASAFNDTDISVSVNWSGGGEVKKPGFQWTLPNLVLVANAFPSMVARHSTKTSAILTRYETLRSFRLWQMKTQVDFSPLDYAPCVLYTNDLFSAFMSYKLIWEKINNMLRDAPKYHARQASQASKKKAAGAQRDDDDELTYHSNLKRSYRVLRIDAEKEGRREELKHTTKDVAFSTASAPAPPEQPPTSPGSVQSTPIILRPKAAEDIKNFPLSQRELALLNADHKSLQEMMEMWRADVANHSRTPIPNDPLELNKARLICREAMTLIVEEANKLVLNPDLARATVDAKTGATMMKLPEYSFPEILDVRLPVLDDLNFSGGSTTEDYSLIPGVIAAQINRYDYGPFIGDPAPQGRTHIPFCTNLLPPAIADAIVSLSIHGHHAHQGVFSSFSAAADGAIGGLGFAFAPRGQSVSATGHKEQKDGCTHHVGKAAFHEHHGRPFQRTPSGAQGQRVGAVGVCKVVVTWAQGSGRIDGLKFVDKFGLPVVEWEREWDARDGVPRGLRSVELVKPEGLGEWRFAGLAGAFDKTGWHDPVLARIGVIWEKV